MDNGDITRSTRLINGGYIGLHERTEWLLTWENHLLNG